MPANLTDLLITAEQSLDLRARSRSWISWDLNARQLCDLELLLNGAFSPLGGYLNQADYESVCAGLRLRNDVVWPIPVCLDVPESFAAQIGEGCEIALRDLEGVMRAALVVEQVWKPDRRAECEALYGTTNAADPRVARLLAATGPCYVAGRVEGLSLPEHHDFKTLRLTPRQVRADFSSLGWTRVVAFQTEHLMHRAHHDLTLRAAACADAKILVHPIVGLMDSGDADYYSRVRSYAGVLDHYEKGTAKLALLPLATRRAGSREALWQAIIEKNYGCTHFIVAPEHADLLKKYESELAIEILSLEANAAGELPDARLKQLLSEGGEIPESLIFSEVVEELRRSHPPRQKQGFTVFFTGLSGAGKSTIANILRVKLLEIGGRAVTVLDGDLVRKHLSSELGFSKEHRDLHIRRIGYVAAEITKSGGISICAPIAPYDSTRKAVRHLIEPVGGFFLVHINAPIEVCEARDRKGLYAKARAGIIEHFTGVSDPYEAPADAEITIDTTGITAEQAAEAIVQRLTREGFLDR